MERDATISRTESNIKRKPTERGVAKNKGFGDGVKERSLMGNHEAEKKEYKSQLGVIETTDEKIKEEKRARENK
jgi:hypothetical protein